MVRYVADDSTPARSRAQPTYGLGRGAWIAVGWLSLSAGMLALLAFALVGFHRHNALPDPRDALILQVPVYVGTVVYLIVSRLIFLGQMSASLERP